MGYRRASPALAVCLAACGDNNHPGGGTLLVSPQTGLYTDEAGTEATLNWNVPQTVTIDGDRHRAGRRDRRR